MKSDPHILVSIGSYEGGLLGLSPTSPTNFKDLSTEYAFSATEVSITQLIFKHIGVNKCNGWKGNFVSISRFLRNYQVI